MLNTTDRLQLLALAEQSDRFRTEAGLAAAAVSRDAETARQTLRSSNASDFQDPALEPMVESIESALGDQLATLTALVATGDWETVHLRLNDQAGNLSKLTLELANRVNDEVAGRRVQVVNNIRTVQREMFLVLPSTVVLTLLIAAFLSLIVTRTITGPLAQLHDSALSLAAGDFEPPSQVVGNDEIAALGRIFNGASQRLRATHSALAEELEERTRAEKEIRGLSARLINAQEDERGRLARELHDDLSQQIAALSIATGILKTEIPEEQAGARAQSDRLQQKLADLAGSVRRLSHELHPAVLKHAGLVAALRGYCSEFSALTKVSVTLEADGAFDGVPPAASLCIYRIVQEGLQNVAKHARVAEASVQLELEPGVVSLTIADRGVGMALDRRGAAAGLGLVSIKERTRLVNGTVSIQSAPNDGTTITVRIPADNWAAASS